MRHWLLVVALFLTGCLQSVEAGDGFTVDSGEQVVESVQLAGEIGEWVMICGKWNVREGASEVGPVLGWRIDGAVSQVLERDSGWLRIGVGQWINEQAVCDE